MTKPDIFLGEDETTVVKRLEIGVDREKSSDIQLKPDVANIHLGGGGGNKSEGDIKLLDKDGNSRVQLTAGGGKEEPTNSVFVDAETANLRLGGGDGSETEGDVRLFDKDGDSRVQLTAGGGKTDATNTVLVDGQTATISVGGLAATEAGSIELVTDGLPPGTAAEMDASGDLTLGGSGGSSGAVDLVRSYTILTEEGQRFMTDPAITLEADDATATVGGAGADGIVNLQNNNEAVTVEIRGDAGQIVTGGHGTAGSVLLKNDQAEPVGFVKASGDDVVFTTVSGGGNETVAMRIRPDGTVEFPQGGP